ncbi:MAG: sugar ABC transporter permease [Propionibacteriaceae bacterium]|jgi:multiple sugar transport system permease protein|nr:sugar ABC transporter permease [Propionibacteriaceae bacterium]
MRPTTRRRGLVALAFLGPALLGMAVFFVYPLAMTVYYSFTTFNILSSPKWNDFANWKYLVGQDPLIVTAAVNTLWLIVILVPIKILGALLVAWALTRARHASGVLRTIFYLPALIPPVASTIAFVFVLNPSTGPVNQMLSLIGLRPGWFTDPAWSKPSLVGLSLWVLGDIMVIFLAALLDVPTEQLEAAELDGAGGIARFWHIIVPAIRPVLLFALVTGIINAMQMFTEPAVASGTAMGKATVGAGSSTTLGWPSNSTLTYGQLLYQRAFGSNLMGYASAMAVVMFVVTGLVMIFLLRRFSGFTAEVAR